MVFTKIRVLLVASILVFSQVFADDFEYQENLIACQHNFSSCNVSLLNAEDKKNIQATKIELAQELKEKDKTNKTIADEPSVASNTASKSTVRPISSSSSRCAENGSCYGDISVNTGRPKTVAVKGYYRKDGTYVRGHYRSKPK